MSHVLEQQYQNVLLEQSQTPYTSPSPDGLLALTDLTCLEPEASTQKISEVAELAYQTKAASICVLPQHLALIPAHLSLKKTTVINFPQGDQSLSDLLRCMDQWCAQTPVQEMDFVFPYRQYLEGNESKALALSLAVHQHAKQHGLITKVIIETGALPSLEIIYNLSLKLLAHEIDFIKTSTGKIASGATLPAAFSILSALKVSQAPSGVKFSGGIRTAEQALTYLQLTSHCLPLRTIDATWLRFGTSSALRTPSSGVLDSSQTPC